MNGIENLAMVGAVIVAMGMLGHGWQLLLEIKNKINEKSNSLFKPSRGVAPNVNRWSRCAAGMHSNHNIVESDGLPTTHVTEEEFNKDTNSIRLEWLDYLQENSGSGVEAKPANPQDNDQAIKRLEKGQCEIAEHVENWENMTAHQGNQIDLDIRPKLAEVENTLRDAIFILYGGSKNRDSDSLSQEFEEYPSPRKMPADE